MKTRLISNLKHRASVLGACGAGIIATLALSSAALAQQGAPSDDSEAGSEDSAASDSSAEPASAGTSASFSLTPETGADGSAGVTSSGAAGGETSATGTGQATGTSVPAYAGARATRREMPIGERFAQLPYMQRYRPEANLWEVGMFGGLMFPSKVHNLKVQVLPREQYSAVAGQLGGRLAYFPLSWLGAELEGFGAGASTRETQFSAVLYSLRAHAIFQLPLYSITPFALVGAGTLGASSETMGHDRDGAIHFGAGVKVPFNHRVSGRFDVRDIMSQKGERAANGRQTHHPELHLGVTFTFDRTPPPLPSDRDYDGLYDNEDKCPDEGALTVDGCPGDSDGDGILDPVDECPLVPGDEPTGCPNLDADGDGVPVPVDLCPDERANTPDGCPDRDLDGDGIIGDADKCPKEPETRNGFEDDDGCPDEMPEAIKRFTGVIQGINFRQGTAEIEPTSFETLDSAVEILIKFPSVRIEISGHTSSEGTEERNKELSVERAEAVRGYFIEKGVGADRIVARGAGPDEPVADNATKEGRMQNRRIEFRVLSQP